MKLIILLTLLMSCSHRTLIDGGQGTYQPTDHEALGPQEQMIYAQTIVQREERDPDHMTLEELKRSRYGEIRRAALVVFETEIQPSRSGLATERNVYLSARAKQWVAEKLRRHWVRELKRLTMNQIEWVSRTKLLGSKAFRSTGLREKDYLLGARELVLNEEDLMWRSGGQKIEEESLISPPDYQNVGVILIPAVELMGGAKPTQHQNQWVNQLAKELELDAVVIAFTRAQWRRGGVDKRTHQTIPEEMQFFLESSVIYPWHKYHAAGELKGLRDLQKLNVKLGHYHMRSSTPVKISLDPSLETLTTAKENIMGPLMLQLERQSSLICERISADLLSTHQPRERK